MVVNTPKDNNTNAKSMSPWVVLKLWSKKILEAIKEHKEKDFRYYSSLALALTVSKELENIEGWEAITEHCIFELLEIIGEPTLVEKKIVVEAKELKVANNYSIDREYLQYKVVFKDELAHVIQSILKPNDCLLIMGGRLQYVDNEKVLEANCHQSRPCTCTTIVILPKELDFMVNSSVIKLPDLVKNKVKVTTIKDPDVRNVVTIISPKHINDMESENEEVNVSVPNIENEEPSVPTCSKYVNFGNVQQNDEAATSGIYSHVNMRKRRIQNTYSSIDSKPETVFDTVSGSMDVEQNEEMKSPSSISDAVVMEGLHNNVAVNEERPAKTSEKAVATQFVQHANKEFIFNFLHTQALEFHTQEISNIDESVHENIVSAVSNNNSNKDSLNSSNGDNSVDSPLRKSQNKVVTNTVEVSKSGKTQVKLICDNSKQKDSLNELLTCSQTGFMSGRLERQNMQENNEDRILTLSSIFVETMGKNVENSRGSTSNSLSISSRHSESPRSPSSQTNSVNDPSSSMRERVHRSGTGSLKSSSRDGSVTSQRSGKQNQSNDAFAREHADSSVPLVALFPHTMSESEVNIRYNLKKAVICVERLDVSDIPPPIEANKAKPKRKR